MNDTIAALGLAFGSAFTAGINLYATIAVLGGGTMGRGIVQVAAQGGMRVLCYDAQAGAAAAAKAGIAKLLTGLAEKGRITAADAEAATARVTVVDDLAAVAKADVIVEAILERLDVKQELFAELEAKMKPGAVMATNTSSIMIEDIAKPLKDPGRLIGIHFFNPAPAMPLVEVVSAGVDPPQRRKVRLGQRLRARRAAGQNSNSFNICSGLSTHSWQLNRHSPDQDAQ